MRKIVAMSSLVALATLSSCSEWRTVVLKNAQTGARAVCAVHWGSLSDEDVQRLRECIAACEARGFYANSPKDVPPARSPVSSAKPPSVPSVCQK